SLEVGKDADVVVWNHHPLSTYAIADRVYIDGTVYYDRLAEDARLTALKKEKSDLAAAETTGRGSGVTGTDQTRDESRGGDAAAESNGSLSRSGAGVASDRPVATTGRGSVSGPVWAITNATIHPITSATIQRGTIVIRGNKIEAVGSNVQVPAGAKT